MPCIGRTLKDYKLNIGIGIDVLEFLDDRRCGMELSNILKKINKKRDKKLIIMVLHV